MQELVGRLLSKEIGTATNFILKEALRTLAFLILNWVRPQYVAKKPYSGRLLKAVQVFQVHQGLQFWRDASVQGQELVIYQA